MSRPPSPETLAKRAEQAALAPKAPFARNYRLDACNVYVEFMKTNPGMPREPMTLDTFVQNVDRVRAYLEGA